jgi:MFS family permease
MAFRELTIFRPLPTIDSTLSPDMNLRSQCVQTTPHNKFKNGWNNDSFTNFPHGSGHEHCHGWHRRQDPRRHGRRQDPLGHAGPGVFATTLNYIDRAALGVMQPILAKEMSWTAMDYANINFWFQVGYAIGFVLQGRLIDRVGVKRVFFCAVLLWSLATGAHGLATSAVGFMVCRFILGLTEAANYPACVKTTRLWFPAGERAVATGIFNAGTNVGAMFTPMLLPLILHVWGWQAAFLCMSALGGIWLLFWGLKYFNPEDHPSVKQSELEYIQKEVEPEQARVPFSRILRMRGTWAFALAYSMTAPVFWFYLYWLPPFLNQQYNLGINVTQMGIPLIIIYLTADFGSVGGGILSSFLIGRGMNSIKARLLSMFLFACCIIGVIMAPVPATCGSPCGHLPGHRRAPGLDREHLEPGDGLHAQAHDEHGVRFRRHVRGHWRDVHDPDRRPHPDRHQQQLHRAVHPDPGDVLHCADLDVLHGPAQDS